MSPNNSLASNLQESELKDLQEELELLSKSHAEFEDQRKRILAILNKRLEKEKARFVQPRRRTSATTSTRAQSLQKDCEIKSTELAGIEHKLAQNKIRLEVLNKEISEKKAEIIALEQSSVAFDDFDELQELSNSLAQESEKLQAELKELERIETGLSSQIKDIGDV